jgi:hypothetical protein
LEASSIWIGSVSAAMVPVIRCLWLPETAVSLSNICVNSPQQPRCSHKIHHGSMCGRFISCRFVLQAAIRCVSGTGSNGEAVIGRRACQAVDCSERRSPLTPPCQAPDKLSGCTPNGRGYVKRPTSSPFSGDGPTLLVRRWSRRFRQFVPA